MSVGLTTSVVAKVRSVLVHKYRARSASHTFKSPAINAAGLISLGQMTAGPFEPGHWFYAYLRHRTDGRQLACMTAIP